MNKKKSDRILIQFVSLLYQVGGWWALLAYEDLAGLAFVLFLVALFLGIYGMRLAKKETEDASSKSKTGT